MQNKNCDLIIANLISQENPVFGSDYNQITIVEKYKITHFDKASKDLIADNIVEQVIKLYNNAS